MDSRFDYPLREGCLLIELRMFLLDRNVNMSKSEEIEPNAGSDADCGTLTSFKLEISKNRAKYRRIEEGLVSCFVCAVESRKKIAI